MSRRHGIRSHKAQVRIPFPAVLAHILVFVAMFGLTYVWLCARCDTLGQDIKRLETAQRDARRRLINEQDRWSNLLAPANLERALKRHSLAMHLPEEQQIVRVRGAGRPGAALAFNK